MLLKLKGLFEVIVFSAFSAFLLQLFTNLKFGDNRAGAGACSVTLYGRFLICYALRYAQFRNKGANYFAVFLNV
jgi:hypothetical protein